MVPPPSTSGAPPKAIVVSMFQIFAEYVYAQPMKKRNTMNWLMLLETAAAMVKMMKKKLQP
jgi:hypothetical protein